MNLRNFLLLTGLAVFMAGCIVNPRPHYRDYDNPYDDSYYYDYRNTPSYEGYYYVRIIFIRDVPYYVDDDRYIRPIPPRLHDHFRRYPYNTLGRPPVFSPDREVRDGYPVSRIIYFDGVPYNVGNDRNAQPLPERLQPRFRYTPLYQDNRPSKDYRAQPPAQPPSQHDEGRNIEPPVQFRDQDRARIQQQPFAGGQREGGNGTSFDSGGRMILSPETHNPPQDQSNSGGSNTDNADSKARDRSSNRPQAIGDTAKMNADKKEPDKKNTDKKKSRKDKKNKQDNGTKPDDGSDKKSRNGTEGDQGGNDRFNGNRRD